jgi:hypothetical protein
MEKEKPKPENIFNDYTQSMSVNQLLSYQELWGFWISVLGIFFGVVYYLLSLPYKEVVILAMVVIFIIMSWKTFFR